MLERCLRWFGHPEAPGEASEGAAGRGFGAVRAYYLLPTAYYLVGSTRAAMCKHVKLTQTHGRELWDSAD